MQAGRGCVSPCERACVPRVRVCVYVVVCTSAARRGESAGACICVFCPAVPARVHGHLALCGVSVSVASRLSDCQCGECMRAACESAYTCVCVSVCVCACVRACVRAVCVTCVRALCKIVLYTPLH